MLVYTYPGNARQFLVSRFFFRKCLFQNTRAVVATKLSSIGDQAAITGYFIMLDRLMWTAV